MFGVSVRAVQSGVHTRAHALPLPAQVLEPPLALGGDRVVHALAAIHALAASLQCPAFLERVEHGIDDAFAKADGLARDEAHGFDDFVAIHLAAAQHPKDKKLGNAA